jgi:VIT1/CCC1 family predicted Fe2+/Mn2+ transporter
MSAQKELVRNFIFGVEDSLASTVGLLAGITVAGVSQSEVIIAGIVLIFVEAFSMGIGTLLSEHTAAHAAKQSQSLSGSLKNGIVMLVSYFFAGFIPLAPYFLLTGGYAIAASVVVSLAALFVLGFGSGCKFKINPVKEGMEMLLIGGLAVLIGVVIGIFFSKT